MVLPLLSTAVAPNEGLLEVNGYVGYSIMLIGHVILGGCGQDKNRSANARKKRQHGSQEGTKNDSPHKAYTRQPLQRQKPHETHVQVGHTVDDELELELEEEEDDDDDESPMITSTVKEHESVLPNPSEASQSTVVTPTEKALPLAGVQEAACKPSQEHATLVSVVLQLAHTGHIA